MYLHRNRLYSQDAQDGNGRSSQNSDRKEAGLNVILDLAVLIPVYNHGMSDDHGHFGHEYEVGFGRSPLDD